MPLKKNRTILLRQIFAGFFLALFIFIHVVKITHHHNLAERAIKGLTQGSKDLNPGDCSICSYQIAKDTHDFHGFLFALKPEKHLLTYSIPDTPFITSIGATSSGRGPPSFS